MSSPLILKKAGIEWHIRIRHVRPLLFYFLAKKILMKELSTYFRLREVGAAPYPFLHVRGTYEFNDFSSRQLKTISQRSIPDTMFLAKKTISDQQSQQ